REPTTFKTDPITTPILRPTACASVVRSRGGEGSEQDGRRTRQVRALRGRDALGGVARVDRPRRLHVHDARHRGRAGVRGARLRRLRDREEANAAVAQAGAGSAVLRSCASISPDFDRRRVTSTPNTKPPTWAKKATPPPFAPAPKIPKFASMS